ncbi:MAG: YfhO family protein, partial [Anaerolineae bacterium]
FVVRLRRRTFFWLLVAALAFLLAFGGHTFLYNVAYLLLPGFGSVRDQERIIYLFGFAASVLAGYGALLLVQPLPRPVRKGVRRFARGLRWVLIAFLLLAALFYFGYLQGQQQGVAVNLFEGLLRHHVLLLLVLGGAVLLFALRLGRPRRRAWMAGLALGLMGLNLFTVNWKYNLAPPQPGGPFPQTGLVEFLQGQPGVGRISSAGLLPGGASAGIVYELEDITGNTPLQLERFRQFEQGLGSWRRWQLLNVRHVLDERDLDGPGLERVYEEGEVKVYRVGDPYPRAWLVHETVTAGDAQALALLDDEGFDPRAVAVLPPGASTPSLGGAAGAAEGVHVVEARPGRLALDVSAAADGLLVVSQPWYPGWRARVDGEGRDVQQVDYLLHGLPLAGGSHRVELDYRPSPLPAMVSLAVLLACLGAAFVARRDKDVH